MRTRETDRAKGAAARPTGGVTVDVPLPRWLGVTSLQIEDAEVDERPDFVRIRGWAGAMRVEVMYRGPGREYRHVVLGSVPALERIPFGSFAVRGRELHLSGILHPRWSFHGKLLLDGAVIPLTASEPFGPWALQLAPGRNVRLDDPSGLDALAGGSAWRESLPRGVVWNLADLSMCYSPALDKMTGLTWALLATAPIPVDGLGLPATLESFRFGCLSTRGLSINAGGRLRIAGCVLDAALDIATLQLRVSAERGVADWERLRASTLFGGMRQVVTTSPGAALTDVRLEFECEFAMGRIQAALLRATATNVRGQEETWNRSEPRD
jgi:hypothetical protein